jgi:2-polyprenyl-3-methyl-5-hydroxy-6-metoxy-1,4-benzoquinol methylase
MYITDAYRRLNTELHQGGRYGRHGDKWAAKVTEIVTHHDIKSVLDYGCGQGSLARALAFPISEYDPAIPEKSGLPSPAELVVCTDVMEHIEPELLSNVLDHLHTLSQRMLFTVISTRPAVKFLADGRNAHLIVEPPAFWRKALHHFTILEWDEQNDEIITLLGK